MSLRLVLVGCAITLCLLPRAARAGDRQAALIHLETGAKIRPAEVEPLEKALAADMIDIGFTVVWAEPAVTSLAIGVDPKKCNDLPCRQRLVQALEAQLLAGGRMDRRKDPTLGNVTDLGLWIMDPDKAAVIGEASEHCVKCSAAEVETTWLKMIRAVFVQAGFTAPPEKAPAPAVAIDPFAPSTAPAGAEAPASEDEAPEPAHSFGPRDLFRLRMLKFYMGGAAVVMAGIGVTYILIDGPRFGVNDTTLMPGYDTHDRLPERYATFVPGVLLTGGAVVLLGGAATLFYLEKTRGWGATGKHVSLVPALGPGGAGLTSVVRW